MCAHAPQCGEVGRSLLLWVECPARACQVVMVGGDHACRAAPQPDPGPVADPRDHSSALSPDPPMVSPVRTLNSQASRHAAPSSLPSDIARRSDLPLLPASHSASPAFDLRPRQDPEPPIQEGTAKVKRHGRRGVRACLRPGATAQDTCQVLTGSSLLAPFRACEGFRRSLWTTFAGSPSVVYRSWTRPEEFCPAKHFPRCSR